MLSLCFHLSSLNLCHLISAVVVILFGLDCYINSVFSLFSYSAHTLFDNKLELVFCNLGGLNILMQRRHVEAESITHKYYNSSTILKFYKNIGLIGKIIEKISLTNFY